MDSDSPVEFGARLRAWRGKRLQKEVAPLLNLSLATLKNYELGRTHPPEFCRNCLEKKMEAHR